MSAQMLDRLEYRIHKKREQELQRQKQTQEQNHDDNEPAPPEHQKHHRSTYSRLNLNFISEGMCVYLFKFSLDEIKAITTALGLDEICRFSSVHVTRDLGFAMLVNRYAYSRTTDDISMLIGMSPVNVSVVCNGMGRLVFEQIKWGLQFNVKHFCPDNLDKFADAIFDKGAAFPNIVGFIDETLEPSPCPNENGQDKNGVYNGWKHFPTLKYLSIVTPDGITSSMFGLYVGKTEFLRLHLSLKTQERIENYLRSPPNDYGGYAFYGDPADMISRCLFMPFKGENLDAQDKKTNASMVKVRVAMKWELAKVTEQFNYAKYEHAAKPKSKTDDNDLAKNYLLSTVFKNMLYCVCRAKSRTSEYFGVKPPSIEDYISGLRRDFIDGDEIYMSLFKD